MAEGARYASQRDSRRAGKAFREAIALRPDKPMAYYNLGTVLCNSRHFVEAAQRHLEAKERFPVGSEYWARATASAFDILKTEECAEVTKPEWWNDKELKVLSARVVMAAPNHAGTNSMRALVVYGLCGAWLDAAPRSPAELKEAATHFERTAALSNAPAMKTQLAIFADACRKQAEAI